MSTCRTIDPDRPAIWVKGHESPKALRPILISSRSSSGVIAELDKTGKPYDLGGTRLSESGTIAGADDEIAGVDSN